MLVFYLCGAKYSDADENGVQYMILCHVILGKTEIICPVNKQCHPSSKDVDSGVDDLKHPKYYITWNMNINTHIHPEYKLLVSNSPALKGIQLKVRLIVELVSIVSVV
ncbi:hypothetical protein GQ457_08G024970 [Hibiscus cannabinus]